MENDTLRLAFRLLNKFIMVPIFRLGLGALVGNPLTGYIMVIQTVGRKSGRARYTPVNYALMDGKVHMFQRALIWYHPQHRRVVQAPPDDLEADREAIG